MARQELGCEKKALRGFEVETVINPLPEYD
jgi:hypothetical protein